MTFSQDVAAILPGGYVASWFTFLIYKDKCHASQIEEIIHIYEFLSREEEPLKIFQESQWTHNILPRA